MTLQRLVTMICQGNDWSVADLAEACQQAADDCPTVMAEETVQAIVEGKPSGDTAELHNLATALGMKPLHLYEIARADPSLDPMYA